jgi:hypothetical protein
VQVEPLKSKLKAPGTERLKLKYNTRLSSLDFKFNLRPYTPASGLAPQVVVLLWSGGKVGRCRLTLSNPR